eukprot:scaffold127231_cov48-Attheya_sp.AAC.1
MTIQRDAIAVPIASQGEATGRCSNIFVVALSWWGLMRDEGCGSPCGTDGNLEGLFPCEK